MSISLNPYLIFDGNTREAVHFYEKALGGKVMGIMTFGDMPADPNYPLTDDMKNRVMHAHLKVGEADLMFSDTYEGMPYQPGNTIQMASYKLQRISQLQKLVVFYYLRESAASSALALEG